MEVMDDLQSEVEDGMLKLASRKSVPVMKNCAALRHPEKTSSLGLPVLKGEIGGREVDVMRDTGCQGVVVRKQLVDASQLTAKREAVTKPLRVPDIERHAGVGREQLFKLLQEDPRRLALVDAGRTSRRGGKIVSFEEARGIVYRRYQDLGRNVDVKQVVLPKLLREYVMSVAHDSITGAHLGIRRTKGKRVAIDLVGPINPTSEAGHRFILTLVDYATMFAEAVPLRKIDTESVAEALVDIYSRLGVPEEVLSDK
ncbi:Pol polyprotein [Plakobranchus ocellatus]|uniref:Pol polyprotein n=1 Tax=Plakobranchus ocellatus TaxID=259542 RepID=A0AAV3ZU02_9GAST|nr:Pol polyprotein [Plakobranchus ocellatus]